MMDPKKAVEKIAIMTNRITFGGGSDYGSSSPRYQKYQDIVVEDFDHDDENDNIVDVIDVVSPPSVRRRRASPNNKRRRNHKKTNTDATAAAAAAAASSSPQRVPFDYGCRGFPQPDLQATDHGELV